MDIKLTNLNTLKAISIKFNISLKFLEYIYEQSRVESKLQKVGLTYFGSVQNSYLSEFNLPKKNRKRIDEYRAVLKVESPYHIFYKELLHSIDLIVNQDKSNFIHNEVHGFVKNKNILTNASEHLNKNFLFKIDIKSFFRSISIISIKQVFIKLGLNTDSAELFSYLCTYNDVLQEGLNTSPILANLYCFELDKDLIKLSQKYNVTFTRYSDDITFSSDIDNFPAIEELKKILQKYKFNLNENKTITLKEGQSQYVTGLSISNRDYPRVPRRIKKRIRQQLYYLDKYPYDNLIGFKLRKLYGNIIYTMGIEKKLGKKYKTQFLDILYSHGWKLIDIFSGEKRTKLESSVFHYIDETGIKFDKKNNQYYLGLCVISINGKELKAQNYKKILDLKNEILLYDRNDLSDKEKKKLFHYNEDNISVKEQYVRALRDMQFEAFIAYKKSVDTNPKYSEDYYSLFYSLMNKILGKFKDYNNYIYFEENTKISQTILEHNLNKLKGISKYSLKKGTKDDILLSIPDYILGIFGDCIKSDFSNRISSLRPRQSLTEERKLNEIAEKIRLVYDVDNNLYFSRKNQKRLNCREVNENVIKNKFLIDKKES